MVNTAISSNGNGDSDTTKSKAMLPLHKIHLINDEDADDDDDDDESCEELEQTPQPYNAMTKSHGGESDDDLPKVQKMPKFMRIPNLWDIKIERCESTDDDDGNNTAGPLTGSDGSEWEFL